MAKVTQIFGDNVFVSVGEEDYHIIDKNTLDFEVEVGDEIEIDDTNDEIEEKNPYLREADKNLDIKFEVTKNINDYLYLDENRKQFCIPFHNINKINPSKIYNYESILNYELLEDGNSISKGGVGRAIVGDILFGPLGAIVGSVTGHKQKSTCLNLNIKITINNIESPVEYITFIKSETRIDSIKYKKEMRAAQEVLSALDIICNGKAFQTKSEVKFDETQIPELIKKYKELLDMGAITEEEFEIKKKQLLK